jgi:2-oxoacid:acceptor oxidoreductase delta subunit (pyruvate/2-ketoisovalerate family)
VFLGVGAQLARRVDIPSGDTARILDAVSFLHQVADDDPPLLGRRVAIYGGGDTALDAARTARRLGARDAVIVYRRNREQMPAHETELEEALKEGITIRWLSTVNHYENDHLVIEKMRLNEQGFPEPTGEFEDLGADSLVLALGQDTDLSLLDEATDITIADGVVEVSPMMMAASNGIFAGGDAVPSERTATIAIGHAKRAARGIDAFLAGRDVADTPRAQLATFERLNTWYYADAERAHRPELEIARRQNTFEEIVGGLTEENALFEARRCLSCGNCFECDNCYGVCPDNAVIKLGPALRYEVNYDFCKGCGICVSECPCGAIDMVPEQI